MSVTTEDAKNGVLGNMIHDTFPTHWMYCHNLDFSTFPFLCEMVYRHLNLELPAASAVLFRTNCPFAVFQHYMTVLLNKHLIKYDYHKLNFCWSLVVPAPIAEYLSHISTITVPTGDKIQVNIPKIANPQFTVPKEENKAQIPPGSFGRLKAENHNVYECYVSPYITRRLVEQTRNEEFGWWHPLPCGAYPPGTIPNKNLLGYAEPEKLTPESISVLKKYNFPNTDDIRGRLQIVSELMTNVNNALSMLGNVYKLVSFDTIQQKSTQNLAGVTKVSTFPYNMSTHDVRISELVGDVFCSYPLKSMSVKMNMLYGLKRSRTTALPGFCYTKLDGQAPDNWEYSINHNFNMKEPFQTTKYADYSYLREEYHVATLPKGDKIHLMNDWIKSYNLK